MFVAINVSAQEQVIFYKKTSNRTYFRVATEGSEECYYITYNTNDGNINPRFTRETEYYKKGYDKIKTEEKILPMEDSSVKDIHYEQIASDNRKSEFMAASVKCLDSKDISVKAISKITTSSKLKVGSYYKLFEVSEAQDKSLIGCYVVCQVIERKKSNLSGSEGRLTIRPICVEKQDGTQLRLQPTDILRRGLNRTNVKIWTLIPVFIAGSKAKINIEESIKLRLE